VITPSALLASVILGLYPAAAGAVPVFTRDVSPILLKRCVSCHGSLASYDAARASARSIREQVRSRAMPPWLADPARSLKFSNDARLTDAEVATVVAWIDADTPKGDDRSSAPSKPSPQWLGPDGRPPDAVVTLPEISVAATGEVPYIQQLIKVPFAADRWISAMQLLPGNRRLLHHMGITEVQLPEGMGPKQVNEYAAATRQLGIPDGSIVSTPPAVVDPANPDAYDMLGVYTPGSTIEQFDSDSGKLLKGGGNYYINFNIHYTTTGRPESDRSRLGLWFRSSPPGHQLIRAPIAVRTLIAGGQELLTDAPGTKAEGTTAAIPPIPAYAQSYEVTGVTAYTQAVTLYQLQPHAHMRARDFTYSVVYPEGREVTVLTVPNYDFHWQLAYQLEQPLELPPGSKVIVTAHYENSQKRYDDRIAADDPGRNCGPDKLVYFRRQNQSWDEMFSPLAQYAVAPRAGGASDAPDRGAPQLVRVIGCVEPGHSHDWLLGHAGEPVVTNDQATSADELKSLSGAALGARTIELLGAGVFGPQRKSGHKVAVKGALMQGAGQSRLNVTSLQTLGESCD
jgi:hypothetical protein